MGRLYNLYKKYNSSSVVSTCAYFLSDRVQGIWDVNRRYVCRKIRDESYDRGKRQKKEMKQTRIAYVCDLGIGMKSWNGNSRIYFSVNQHGQESKSMKVVGEDEYIKVIM